MTPASPDSRPWWRHPGPLLALLLHLVVFLGLFPLRFRGDEWHRMAAREPRPATTGEWFARFTETYGWLGPLKWFYDNHGETRLYYRFARVALDGVSDQLPPDAPEQGHLRLYRDVPMEYQPGALLAFVPPALVSRDYEDYITAFTLWCGLLYGAALWLGVRLLAGPGPLTPAQAGRVLWGSVFFLFCFGVIASARFDHAVPLACLAAIALFRRAERTGSLTWYAACGAAIAGGVLVKIVPGVVLPAALLVLVAGGPPRWRPALALGAGFGAALLALNALFLAWWGEGYVRSYTYHLERGIQLETLYSGVLLAAQGFGQPYELVRNYGAAHVATPLTSTLKLLSTVLFFAASAAVAWRFWRLRATTPRPAVPALFLLTVLFLFVFILTNKVLSPQYLLWVGPLLAALYGLRPAAGPALLLLLLASVLSQVIFPYLYDQLTSFQPALVALLNVRNALLLLLFAWLLWRLPRLLASPGR